MRSRSGGQSGRARATRMSENDGMGGWACNPNDVEPPPAGATLV